MQHEPQEALQVCVIGEAETVGEFAFHRNTPPSTHNEVVMGFCRGNITVQHPADFGSHINQIKQTHAIFIVTSNSKITREIITGLKQAGLESYTGWIFIREEVDQELLKGIADSGKVHMPMFPDQMKQLCKAAKQSRPIFLSKKQELGVVDRAPRFNLSSQSKHSDSGVARSIGIFSVVAGVGVLAASGVMTGIITVTTAGLIAASLAAAVMILLLAAYAYRSCRQPQKAEAVQDSLLAEQGL